MRSSEDQHPGSTPLVYPPAQVYAHPDYPLGTLVRIDTGVLRLFPEWACAGQIGEVVQGFFWEGSIVCGYQPDLVPVKYHRRIYAIPQPFVCPLVCGPEPENQDHVCQTQKGWEYMGLRRLEASRVLPIPATPYSLHAEHLPFALVFARTREVPAPARKKDDPPEPPQPDDDPPEATSSDPETTTPDSNDPANDEEIDWMQDD